MGNRERGICPFLLLAPAPEDLALHGAEPGTTSRARALHGDSAWPTCPSQGQHLAHVPFTGTAPGPRALHGDSAWPTCPSRGQHLAVAALRPRSHPSERPRPPSPPTRRPRPALQLHVAVLPQHALSLPHSHIRRLAACLESRGAETFAE